HAVEQIERHLRRASAAQHAQEAQHRLTLFGLLVPVVANIDVMRLYVENELVLGPFLLEGFLVLDLVGGDLVDRTENLIEGRERRGHAAGGAKEIAPAQSLAARRLLAQGG